MEAVYVADRTQLRHLLVAHPGWKNKQYAEAVKRSLAWVKKWRRRFRDAEPDDESVVWGLSRTPKHRRRPVRQDIIEAVLDIRDHPPGNLKRVPGPKTILYYLNQNKTWRQGSLPQSSKTIWHILREHGRIAVKQPLVREHLVRPAPMEHWEIDWKDASSVPADPDGKQQHVVETLNIVDRGTSILVDALVRGDFTMETTIYSLAQVFAVQGLPSQLTCDRDTRLVGSPSGRDFPSAAIRFMTCLGIQVNVCDPRRPDQKGFVERYNKNYKYECLLVHRPTTIEATQTVTDYYKRHYNSERPSQALSCGNRPPYVAFPKLPVLPSLPDRVDPDAWLTKIHGQRFIRHIDYRGVLKVDNQLYYVKQSLRGQTALVEVDAHQRKLHVYINNQLIKSLPVKGLRGMSMPFQDYLAMMGQQARTEWRRTLIHRSNRH